MDNEEAEDNDVNSNTPINSIIQTTRFDAKTLPSVPLFEQQGPGGLDHEATFGVENEDNILDPITEYMRNDSDGAYVPPK